MVDISFLSDKMEGRLEKVFKRALGAVLIGLGLGKTIEFTLIIIFGTPMELVLAWSALTIIFFTIFMYWGEIVERATEDK